MKIKTILSILSLFFIGFNSNAQTQSVSVGYGWNNLPFQFSGFGVNTDYVIPISDKWIFKPNAGYKTSKQEKGNPWLTSNTNSYTLNASFGYTLIEKNKYKLIPYLAPSVRYRTLKVELNDKDMEGFFMGDFSGERINLNSSQPKASLNHTRFGYSIHLENQFQIGSKYVSFVPYLEPDINFYHNFGGFYISYYFR